MSSALQTRREFLGQCGRCALFLGTAGALLSSLEALAKPPPGGWPEIPRENYDRLPDAQTRCRICPWECQLKPGETSFCRTRVNDRGVLRSHGYGNPCVMTVDPIEKMPLSHYRPGKQSLSVTVGGCNLRCLYCQNYRESQAEPDSLTTFEASPERIVKGIRDKKLDTVGFTYTELTAFYEFGFDVASAAKEQNLYTIAASNGYIQARPLRELCRVIDAFAVTLKAFGDDEYFKLTGVPMAPVLDSLRLIKEQGKWLEVVHLIVPTYNDAPAKTKEMCKWLRQNLGRDVPLHIGRFVPEHKLRNLPRTPVATLEQARQIAQEAELRYVYIFNLSPHPGNNTFCPKCRKELVSRLGYQTRQNLLRHGHCPQCSTQIPGVWR